MMFQVLPRKSSGFSWVVVPRSNECWFAFGVWMNDFGSKSLGSAKCPYVPE